MKPGSTWKNPLKLLQASPQFLVTDLSPMVPFFHFNTFLNIPLDPPHSHKSDKELFSATKALKAHLDKETHM
ncbi:hypothetical protein Fmac_005569 [Flemingia macrophylla]|uniref:Uncharacterized protein n=1 Tax=Flemingia macrophylla TaxID=520843 RepID=A0ABD1N879_9FABA